MVDARRTCTAFRANICANSFYMTSCILTFLKEKCDVLCNSHGAYEFMVLYERSAENSLVTDSPWTRDGEYKPSYGRESTANYQRTA
jgi:hypothetical protein